MTERTKTVRLVLVVAALVTFLFPRDVHAYLDPGAGSMVFQTVLAAIVAVAYAVRMYWGKLSALFGRARRIPPSEPRKTP